MFKKFLVIVICLIAFASSFTISISGPPIDYDIAILAQTIKTNSVLSNRILQSTEYVMPTNFIFIFANTFNTSQTNELYLVLSNHVANVEFTNELVDTTTLIDATNELAISILNSTNGNVASASYASIANYASNSSEANHATNANYSTLANTASNAYTNSGNITTNQIISLSTFITQIISTNILPPIYVDCANTETTASNKALVDVDGVALVAGTTRVLISDASVAATRGIWIAQSGDWIRAADADEFSEILGRQVFVTKGTVYRGLRFNNENGYSNDGSGAHNGTNAQLWSIDINRIQGGETGLQKYPNGKIGLTFNSTSLTNTVIAASNTAASALSVANAASNLALAASNTASGALSSATAASNLALAASNTVNLMLQTNGSIAMASNLNMGGNIITNVGTPSTSNHAARMWEVWQSTNYMLESISYILTNSTIQTNQSYIICTNTNDITIILPTAVGNTGKVFNITEATRNGVVIKASGSELIDRYNTFGLYSLDKQIEIISDGTGWKIIGNKGINYRSIDGSVTLTNLSDDVIKQSAAGTTVLTLPTTGGSVAGSGKNITFVNGNNGTFVIDGNGGENIDGVPNFGLSQNQSVTLTFGTDGAQWRTIGNTIFNQITNGGIIYGNGYILSNIGAGTSSNNAARMWEIWQATNNLSAGGISESTATNISFWIATNTIGLDDISNVTAPSPSVGEVLTWNGSAWANARNTADIGGGQSYYPTSNLVVGNVDNRILSKTPDTVVQFTNTTTGVTAGSSPQYIERFVSPALNVSNIPAGTWHFDIYQSWSAWNINQVQAIMFRVNKRVIQTNVTVTFIGSGPTRTVISSRPIFSPSDYTTNRMTAVLIETSNQTGWINGYVTNTNVTMFLSDSNYTNETNVTLNALYYHLMNGVSASATAANIIENSTVDIVMTNISVDPSDSLVWALFATNSGSSKDARLIYGGTANYTRMTIPGLISHNDLNGLNIGNYIHLSAIEYSNTTNLSTQIINATNGMTNIRINSVYFMSELSNIINPPTTTIDWSNTSPRQTITLTNSTTFTFINPVGISTLMLKIIQDGSGGRTVTFPTNVLWVGGSIPTPTLAANSISLYSFYFDGSNYFSMVGADYATNTNVVTYIGDPNALYTNGSKIMASNLNMGGNIITNLAEPLTSNHAATKNYVDRYRAAKPEDDCSEISVFSNAWNIPSRFLQNTAIVIASNVPYLTFFTAPETETFTGVQIVITTAAAGTPTITNAYIGIYQVTNITGIGAGTYSNALFLGASTNTLTTFNAVGPKSTGWTNAGGITLIKGNRYALCIFVQTSPTLTTWPIIRGATRGLANETVSFPPVAAQFAATAWTPGVFPSTIVPATGSTVIYGFRLVK
jgi:hypothetical protein